MAMTPSGSNKYDFVDETTAEYGPFTAIGPVGLVCSGSFGASGKVAIKPWVGDDFDVIPAAVFESATIAKVDFAVGDLFKIAFSDGVAIKATLTFYSSAEQ